MCWDSEYTRLSRRHVWGGRGRNILLGLYRGGYPIHHVRRRNVARLNLGGGWTFPLLLDVGEDETFDGAGVVDMAADAE